MFHLQYVYVQCCIGKIGLKIIFKEINCQRLLLAHRKWSSIWHRFLSSQRTCTKYSITMFFFCRKPNKKRKRSSLWLHHPSFKLDKYASYLSEFSDLVTWSQYLAADFKACIDIGYISRVYFWFSQYHKINCSTINTKKWLCKTKHTFTAVLHIISFSYFTKNVRIQKTLKS
jgi:hypothetical protein